MATKDPYLVQRGKFENTKDKDIAGIDSLIRFDYMGSAEFEWGSLPASLKAIMRNWSNYIETSVKVTNIGGRIETELFITCKKNEEDAVKEIVRKLAEEDKYRTKEYVGLKKLINGDDYITKERVDFWWDIREDWFVCLNKIAQKRLSIAIQQNIKRNVPDVSKPNNISSGRQYE